MANFNTKYYRAENDSLYTDGDIENEILQRVVKNDTTLENDSNWAVFYHFSPLRQNILNWYAFKENATILEIGAGCGALTGLLLRRGSKVKACELTMQRAKILFYRYASAENLEVCVGNILDMEFEEKFDYVILNGVLEYAISILGDTPEKAFLGLMEYAKQQLKPDGIVLLAIENRFGIKYFAGAPEDHVGSCYAGINGYKRGEKVRTFTKTELKRLIVRAGFKNQTWFYPYPDYKFPIEIFTDRTINNMSPTVDDIPYDAERALIFDRDEVQDSLRKEKIADKFANSFLVELSNSAHAESSPDYIKISSNRKKEFQLYTSIDVKRQMVKKCALHQMGCRHIEDMQKGTQVIHRLKPVPVHYSNGTLEYAYINKKSLRQHIEELAFESRSEKIWNILATLRDELFSVSSQKLITDIEFRKVFGNEQCDAPLHWLKHLNIDLNADNLFPNEDEWWVIDNDWVFSFAVPTEYVLWRLLAQLRERKALKDIFPQEKILSFLNITQDEERIFYMWETYFANNYVGIRDLSVQQKSIYDINLDEVLAREKNMHSLHSQLFLTDLSGKVSVLSTDAHWSNNKWCVCFSDAMIKDASDIRWDPFEGSASCISEVHIEDINLNVIPINAENDEPIYTFFTFDPQFRIVGDWSACKQIKICFSCRLIDWTRGYFKRETELAEIQEQNNTLQDLLETEKADKEKCEAEKNEHASREQDLMRINQGLADRIRMLEAEIERIHTMLNEHPVKSAARTLLRKEI